LQHDQHYQRHNGYYPFTSRSFSTCCSSSPTTRSSWEQHRNKNDTIATQKVEATKKWLERIVIGEKLCPFAAPLLKHNNCSSSSNNNNQGLLSSSSSSSLLRIVSSSATTVEQVVEDVRSEVFDLMMDNNPVDAATTTAIARHETTLIVLGTATTTGESQQQQQQQQGGGEQPSFLNDYREFVRLSWELQTEAVGEAFRDSLQLVLFHPRATHQTYATTMTSDEEEEDDGGGGGAAAAAAAADYTIRSPYPTIHLLREQDVMKAVLSGYPDLEYLPSRNKAKFVKQGITKCRERLEECYSHSNKV